MSTNDIMAKVTGLEAVLGYQFRDSLLAWKALQAPGSSVTSIGGRRLNVQMALCDDWYGGAESKGMHTFGKVAASISADVLRTIQPNRLGDSIQ